MRYDDFIGAWSINVKTVLHIDRVIESRAKSMILRLAPNGQGEQLLMKLHDVLLPYREGNCEVAVQYFGDAAAAFVMGKDNVIAEFKGSYSLSYDFADHYRGKNATYDRQWEDRWIRDLGFDQFVPQAVNGLLDKMGLKIEVHHHEVATAAIRKVLITGQASHADTTDIHPWTRAIPVQISIVKYFLKVMMCSSHQDGGKREKTED